MTPSERNFPKNETFECPDELLALGERVSKLSRPEPSADLTRRTLEAASRELPNYREPGNQDDSVRSIPREPQLSQAWWRTPITHPAARLAAAVALAASVGVFGNMEVAERVGTFTERVIGEKTTDRIGLLIDKVWVAYRRGPLSEKDADEIINRLVGGDGLPDPHWRSRPDNRRGSTPAAIKARIS